MYTDDQITAWLDGELPVDQGAEMAALRASDVEFAGRVAALELDIPTIAKAFDPLLELAPRQPVLPGSTGRALWRPVALAASVVLAMLAGYWAVSNREADSWQMEVAHYQALYVPETLAGIEPDPARLGSELSRAGDLMGLDFDLDSLSGIPGLTLRRAQVLGFEGRPLVQVAFTDAAGTPFAFCILKSHGLDEPFPITADTMMQLSAVTWQSRTHGFLVIGGQDRSQIFEYATQLSAVF